MVVWEEVILTQKVDMVVVLLVVLVLALMVLVVEALRNLQVVLLDLLEFQVVIGDNQARLGMVVTVAMILVITEVPVAGEVAAIMAAEAVVVIVTPVCLLEVEVVEAVLA